ncbi:hypothetical protein ES703_87102 [subsurface metagenome]
MRRAIARGRIVPQSLSTDPRLGRLSLKAALLFPLMWVNCDDQGRISGDPDEIKYATCPNIDHIAKADIPELLKELEKQGFMKVYATSKTMATQMLDWWEVQKLQWAYPSEYPPAEGWQDRLRFHASPTHIVTENWPSKAPNSLPKELPSALPSALPSTLESSPLTTPSENEKEKEKEEEEEEGRLPSALGSTSPSPTDSQKRILDDLITAYRKRWGHVKASDPETVIPREPGAKILAQLRDLSKELDKHDCPAAYIVQAFDEAAGAKKYRIPYVRAILFEWLGIERNRSP